MRQQLSPINFYSRLTIVLIPILVGLILLNAAIFIYLRSQSPVPASSSPTIFPTSPSPPSPTLAPSVVLSTPTSAPTPAPTAAPLVKVPVLSTANWRWVHLDGVKFMVPSEVICNPSDLTCSSFLSDPRQRIGSRITVEPYNGGSRRTQYLGTNTYLVKECHLLFVDSLFGSVPALQIANDGGWCQGGGGATVVVVGDKFVTFHELNYNSNTKEISRYTIRDTMISTLARD